MAEQCFLGVDLGAESGRVMAGLFDGERIRLDVVQRFRNGGIRIADTLRWDALGLWKDIHDGLRDAATKYGDDIVSLGVDTWGVDFVLLSKSGEMLGLPWHYRDLRNQGMMELAFSRVPQAEIFAATGLQFMPINSLYQLLAFRQQSPQLMDLADRFLMMADFFHWCLCGTQVVEFTNATTSQCLDAVKGDWAWDMLQKLELPTDMFPQVVAPGTKLGRLRESVALSTHLGRIDVVTPATHDTAAAVAAVPTSNTGQPNWAYISSGTWSLMGVEVNDAITTPQAFAWNMTNEGGIDGTYRLLKNIMGLWLVQQCRATFLRQGSTHEYADLVRLAESAEPFRSLIDPDDPAFLAPRDMVQAIQDWCRDHDQPIPETAAQLVRCALESLALKYRVVLSRLETLTGVPVEVIHVVGGGCQNHLLNQFTASACGRPVIAGPVEATALGNVLLQARTAGGLDTLDDLRSIVRASCDLQRFEPQRPADWNAAFERFRSLMS